MPSEMNILAVPHPDPNSGKVLEKDYTTALLKFVSTSCAPIGPCTIFEIDFAVCRAAVSPETGVLFRSSGLG